MKGERQRMHLYLACLLLVQVIGQCDSPPCDEKRIVFTRLRFASDSTGLISLRLHVQSSASTTMHALVKFSSVIGVYHATLLLDSAHMRKYQTVRRVSRFEHNNKLTLVTRAVSLDVDYFLVASQKNTTQSTPAEESPSAVEYLTDLYDAWSAISTDTSYGQYDAVFSLAPYSSIWGQYNVMAFEHQKLILLYRENATLMATAANFAGMVRFQCDSWYGSATDLSHSCFILRSDPVALALGVPASSSLDRYPGASVAYLEVNDRQYANYRVKVDFDSAVNYLPLDLYLVWQAAQSRREKHLRIKLYESSAYNDGANVLHLNAKFQYELTDAEDIVLGRDLIHNFPRLEYAMDRMTGARAMNLWFHASDVDPSDMNTGVRIFFMFLLLATLFCLFIWGTISNYYLVKYVILLPHYARQYHLFAYKQMIFELLTLVVAALLWIFTLVFSDATTGNQQRLKYCLIALSAYHALVLVIVMLLTPQVNEKIRNYFKKKKPEEEEPTVIPQKQVEKRSMGARQLGATLTPVGSGVATENYDEMDEAIEDVQDRETREIFQQIKDREERRVMYSLFMPNYNDRLVRESTAQSLIRSLALIVLILTNLLLILNFSSAGNLVYLLFIVILSLTLVYYVIKYLMMGEAFLLLTHRKEKQVVHFPGLLAFMVLEIVVLFLYLGFSFDATYMNYFMTINSIYSEAVVEVLAITLIGCLFVAGVYLVVYAAEWHAEELERQRQKTLRREKRRQQAASQKAETVISLVERSGSLVQRKMPKLI